MLLIAVCGGKECDLDTYRTAECVGTCVANAGATLLCGGLTGVMEAAAKGAKKAGGLTLGILPGADRRAANQYIDVVITTGVGFARNLITANSCDGMVAIDGKFGTLSEIAYALDAEKPVALINSWSLRYHVMESVRCRSFTEPIDAVQWLVDSINH